MTKTAEMEYEDLCLHDYEIIHDDINIKQTQTNSIAYEEITGYILLYCRKCLDVKIRELS